MKTILIIFIVYWSGFALTWIIAYFAIKKYDTKESPLFAALFSWLIVAVVLVAAIYKEIEEPLKRAWERLRKAGSRVWDWFIPILIFPYVMFLYILMYFDNNDRFKKP